jgi:hypothetical protein
LEAEGLSKLTNRPGKPFTIKEIDSSQDSQLGQTTSMCEDNTKKSMSSAMADGENPVDSAQPMTLDELEAGEDNREEQMSNNTLPTGRRKSMQFFPNGGPDVKNAAVESMMKGVQCRGINTMSAQEVRNFAATIAEHPDEHSNTVMLATAVRALEATMPNGEPQLQQLQQPSSLHQVQGIGNTTSSESDRQHSEQRQELTYVECQNGFSGFDDLNGRTDELRAEQHLRDEQAYVRRGGCGGCHGSKYSEETGFCRDCLYCMNCCLQRYQTEGEGGCGQQNLDLPRYDMCANCDCCWRCCVEDETSTRCGLSSPVRGGRS